MGKMGISPFDCHRAKGDSKADIGCSQTVRESGYRSCAQVHCSERQEKHIDERQAEEQYAAHPFFAKKVAKRKG